MTKDKIHQKNCVWSCRSQKYKFKENCPEFSTQGQIVIWSNAMKFFRSCLFFFHKILKREYYYHYTFKGQFLGPPLTSQYVLIAGSLIFFLWKLLHLEVKYLNFLMILCKKEENLPITTEPQIRKNRCHHSVLLLLPAGFKSSGSR